MTTAHRQLWFGHTARAFVLHFAALLVILLLVFTIAALVQLAGRIAASGLSPFAIAELLLTLALVQVPVAAPPAMLLAAILVAGQMAASRELTALYASGVSAIRALAGIWCTGGLLCLAMLPYAGYVKPALQGHIQHLVYDNKRVRPERALAPQRLVHMPDGISLRYQENAPGGAMRQLVLWQRQGGATTTIAADSAVLVMEEQTATLLLELWHGEVHKQTQKKPDAPPDSKYERSYFDRLLYRIDLLPPAMKGQHSPFLKAQHHLLGLGGLVQLQQDARDSVDAWHLKLAARQDSLWRFPVAGRNTSQLMPYSPDTAQLQEARRLLLARKEILTKNRHTGSMKELNLHLGQRELHTRLAAAMQCVLMLLCGIWLGMRQRSGTLVEAALWGGGVYVLHALAELYCTRMVWLGLLPVWAGVWLPLLLLASVLLAAYSLNTGPGRLVLNKIRAVSVIYRRRRRHTAK